MEQCVLVVRLVSGLDRVVKVAVQVVECGRVVAGPPTIEESGVVSVVSLMNSLNLRDKMAKRGNCS